MAKTHTASTKKYPYKEPRLVKPSDNDLTKQWVVEYGVWSEREEQVKRKRIVLSGDSVEARLADSKAVIKDLKAMLKEGVVVDALRKEPTSADVPDGVAMSTKLSKVIELYLAYKEKTTKPNSFRTYRSSLSVLQQYLKDTPQMKNVALGQFYPSDAIHFLDMAILKYGLSNRGRNNTKDNAQGVFLHWMKRINRPGAPALLTNPFDGITDLNTISRKHVAFRPDQREPFRQACLDLGEDNLLLFVQFMFYTFFRPREELRNLRVGDIRENTIRVSGVAAKDNAEEYVEIPPPLEALIVAYRLRDYPLDHYVFTRDAVPGPEPVGKDYFYHHHRRVLEHLEWQGQNYDTYSWKHTGVIMLWQATQNIRLIQQHCRHSTAAQTEQYLRDLGIIIRHTQIQDFPEF